MSYDYELTDVLPAEPRAVYDAWMSSNGHAAMTETDCSIDPCVGGEYTCGSGYMHGRTLVLEPHRRIVQTWRTVEFGADDPDSEIEILLEPIAGGTKLTLHHRNVPDGQLEYEHGGWQDNYFEPMKAYFGERKARPQESSRSR
jgi:activator of HSP90 ATPase